MLSYHLQEFISKYHFALLFIAIFSYILILSTYTIQNFLNVNIAQLFRKGKKSSKKLPVKYKFPHMCILKPPSKIGDGKTLP